MFARSKLAYGDDRSIEVNADSSDQHVQNSLSMLPLYSAGMAEVKRSCRPRLRTPVTATLIFLDFAADDEDD